MLHKHLFLLAFIGVLPARGLFAQAGQDYAQTSANYAKAPASYAQEIETWHARRIKNLKAPEGWLNLAGLYWLDEGKNSFGSDPGNKIPLL